MDTYAPQFQYSLNWKISRRVLTAEGGSGECVVRCANVLENILITKIVSLQKEGGEEVLILALPEREPPFFPELLRCYNSRKNIPGISSEIEVNFSFWLLLSLAKL